MLLRFKVLSRQEPPRERGSIEIKNKVMWCDSAESPLVRGGVLKLTELTTSSMFSGSPLMRGGVLKSL